jgi:hypothetical protein
MGHKDAGIFQAYINERTQCDVQAAFLGRPSANALFKSMSHMKRDVDARAPTTLTDSEKDSLKTHPLLIELRELRDNLSYEARKEYKTLKLAEQNGSKIYELYQQAKFDLENTKQRLIRNKKKESRKDFFDRIETEDARRQLGISALDFQENWKPTQLKHTLEEREQVARLLCNHPSDLTPQGKLRYRIKTIEALVTLCRKKEIPQKKKKTIHEHNWGIPPTLEPTPMPSNKLEPRLAPKRITNRQCIFCICKTNQITNFCRPRKAREHVEKQHLRWFQITDLIPCPDEYCRSRGIVLVGHSHFKSHVQIEHGCSLLPYTLK